MSVQNVRRFAGGERGAVTVDWVALTAAVVVIGIGLTYAVFGTADNGIGGPVATSLPDPAGGDGN